MPVVQKQAAKPKRKKAAKPKGVLDRIKPIGFDEEEGIKINLYGKSGTGKTSLWGTFPDPILAIICSGGSRPGELRSIDTPENRGRIKSVVIESSAEISEIVEYQKDSEEFATVVLDHASGLQDLKLKEILEIDELPAQLGWGVAQQQDWGQCALQTKETLRALLSLKCNVVIVAQERNFNTDGDSESILMPTVGSALTPSITGWLNPACDYIAQTFIRNKTKEVVRTVGKKKIPKTVRLEGVDYCLRVGPDEVYTTKFRVPGGVSEDIIVNPDYSKIINIIQGG
jgi:hypothetical protein|tara:strand:- start:987 stop:1841 length:855 start_codon:yes stop_codon:yes gene_type:complete